MIIRKTIALGGIVAVLAGGPAWASQPQRDWAPVRVADLDLSTPAGIKLFNRRVTNALNAVCGSYSGTELSAGRAEAEEVSRCRAVNRDLIDRQVAVRISANAQVASAH